MEKKKESYVIYFSSKVEKDNTGYFQRMQRIGFLSTRWEKQAKVFKSRKAVENKIKSLIEKEGEWYDFKIIESI